MWTLILATGVVLATVAAARGGGFTPSVEKALESSKNLYVATTRKDGSRSTVAPIWFMYDGDAVYFTTAPGTYKAKRIAAGRPVHVWVGAADGPHFVATGEILRDPEVATRMAPAYDQKYWISWMGLFRPRPDRVREGKTLIIRLRPIDRPT
jgi:PPOX class probable F420-dependent enzyme